MARDQQRVLHVIPSANPAAGGPIEAVTRLGLEYERMGATVEIVTLDNPNAQWLRTFPLTCHALGPSLLKYGYTRRLVPWLETHAKYFDVVVVNGLWQYTSFGAWRALRRMGKSYVVFTHGMLDPWFKRRYPLKHVKKWMYWPWAEYRVLRDATAVLFTSEEERRLARHSFWLYDCKELVINYGTAPPPNDSEQQRALFWQTFPALRDRRIVLFFGRIHEKKGCELLVRAFGSRVSNAADGADDRPPWHLVLAGPVASHRYRRRLERLIDATCPAGSVTWTGLLTGELKWGAFRAADVFALPSHQENFGVAVAEAMACRVPVLISNKVNIWREIADDHAGLVDNDDEAGTRAVLSAWMSMSDADRDRMRQNAADCFERRFDIRQTARSLNATLHTLFNGG
jgi:glycosyltransferase involved in cell wall biosynthesis